jgi:DNA primase
MISEEDKERVRQATDIVALVGETVVLRQRGSEFWGCCPFHHEKSPSFHVNPTNGLWKCFGCGAGGDVFAYVMKRESLDFPDAIRYLADRAGIELVEERGAGPRGPKRNRLVEALGEAEGFFSLQLMRGKGEGAAAARSYLAGRGFGSAVCGRWDLGFAPGNGALVGHLSQKGFGRDEILAADLAVDRGGVLRDRFYDRAMFPIHDEQGRCIGFGGRVIGEGKPKYLNTRETSTFHKSKNLFAFDRAKESIAAKGEAVVVEGYTDVISLHEAGFTNVVATLGTALTEDHVKLLTRFASTIICMFDGDAAGQRAAEHAIQYLDRTKARLLCVVLPDDLDPAEFVAARGGVALTEELEGAVPLVDFVLDKRLSSVDLSSPGQRVAALGDMASLLAPLKHSVLLDSYATQVADRLGVTVDETKRRIRDAPVATQLDVGKEPSPEVVEDELREPSGPTTAEVLGTLSPDDRSQLRAERELLTLMAATPDVARADAERIAALSWVDDRDRAIAWAMLATKDGTSPKDVVRAATEACDLAPRILSAGRLVVRDELSDVDKMTFAIDNVELYSCRRRVRAIKARLEGHVGKEEMDELFRQATDLQRRAKDLAAKISAMA